MAAFEVIKAGQIVQAEDFLVVHEEVDSVDSHGLEVASKLDVADDRHQVSEQALEAATLFDPVSDALVKGLEASRSRRNLRLHPRSEVERVVEDFLVCRTLIQFLKEEGEVVGALEFASVKSTDLSNPVHLPCLIKELLCADCLDKT